MVHYIILLHQAKSAGLGHWAECWGPGDDLPADGVGDVCPVDLPHVAAHAFAVGSVVRVIVPDGVHVTVPPLLEGPARKPSIELCSSSVLPHDLGSVDN